MRPLAVYVHIPFCTVKCGYCDFNAYAGMDSLKSSYRRALIAEVETWAHVLGDRSVTSIGFGGGTPGEVPAADLASVITAIGRAAALPPDAEVSLEANPGSTSLAALQALRGAGVSRVSFGAQSFDADELKLLDRIHSPEAIGGAVALARRAGIPSINLDLIYGIPGQSLAGWRSSLERALALQPDHLSCYALTIEEGTPFARHVANGELPAPDGDVAADMYEAAEEFVGGAGFDHYEISNWARPGHRSRHNQVYWTDGDYLGVGAGAHGYLGGRRYENVAHPAQYIARLASAGTAEAAVLEWHAVSPATAVSDWLSLRLRLLDGFDPADFAHRHGVTLESVCGQVLDQCEAAGLLERTVANIRLTARGRLLHGEISLRLLLHLRTVGPALPIRLS